MAPLLEVLQHVVDTHCHPTDSAISDQSIAELSVKICAMSTRADDQNKVAELALRCPEKVTPGFGYHPWFYHEISLDSFPLEMTKEQHYLGLFKPTADQLEAFSTLLPVLPDPKPLSHVLSDVRSHLQSFPNALLGEVGLDRTFRISFTPYPSPHPRKLTPFSTPLDHQVEILEAQLAIAIELRRNVSIHSVQAQRATIDVLNRLYARYGTKYLDISICLHSCGLSPQTWAEIERAHPNAFMSLSTAINARSPNHESLIRACSQSRILVESDYPDIRECAGKTWDMLCIIARVKGWEIESSWVETGAKSGVVKILERNWQRFLAGGHVAIPKKENRKTRKLDGSVVWESDDGEA